MTPGSRIDVRSIGRMSVIALARPHKRNAIDAAMADALDGAWQAFAASRDRVTVPLACGPMFTAGLDTAGGPAQF
jgi:enoyl-CoA hydratase/carnithine racemase